MQCHSSQKNPTTHQQKTCWYWSFPFFIKKVCTWPAVSIAGNSIFEQKLKTQLWFATLLLDLGSFDGLCIYCFKYDYTCWHFSCSKTNTIMQTHSAIVDSLGEPTDSFGCHKLQCLCANICLQCLRLLSALSYRYCVCVTWINTNKHLHHKMCFWKLQETHPTCLYPPTATCLCSLSTSHFLRFRLCDGHKKLAVLYTSYFCLCRFWLHVWPSCFVLPLSPTLRLPHTCRRT